jgi:hypothetical protein
LKSPFGRPWKPVVPEWADWVNDKFTRRGAIKPLVGLGCSPVLVSGTKKLFLKWIGRALRQKGIRFPEGNRPVHSRLSYSFFQLSNIDLDDKKPEKTGEEGAAVPAEWEDTQSCESY